MLENLLPRLKTQQIEDQRRAQFFDWNPQHAHPTNGKISETLQTYIESSYQVKKEKVAAEDLYEYPKKAPNEANILPEILAEVKYGGSPLDLVHRGTHEEPDILNSRGSLNRAILRTEITRKDKMRVLVLRLINWMPNPLDLFIQNNMSIQSSVVSSETQLIKYARSLSTLYYMIKPLRFFIRTVNAGGRKVSQTEDYCQVLLATLKAVAVATTARQEIKDFSFSMSARIGMEVEMAQNRVICTVFHPRTT